MFKVLEGPNNRNVFFVISLRSNFSRMLPDKYDYEANTTFASFTFESTGPHGVIKKVVNYHFIGHLPDGLAVYNLGFGDWNEAAQKVDDSTISNNQDRNKVLATVASTILVFTEKYGRLGVFAQGVTSAKTRLYQMGLNSHKADVEFLFLVYGLLKGQWLPFESGRNFEAFLVIKK